jgi:hypothetical protein
VRIDVRDDGAGTVTAEVVLDEEALARLGDPRTAIRTDDLEAAGWSRSAPTRRGNDTVVAVTKPFRSPGDLQAVLSEVGGDMFRRFEVTLDDGFATTRWEVQGAVEVTGTLDSLGDERLASALDGLPIGRTPDELADEFGGTPTVPLHVDVRLPTTVDHAGQGATSVDQSTRRWTVDLARGGEQQRQVTVDGSAREATPFRWFAVAALLLVAAAAWRIMRAMRRRPPSDGAVAPPQ